MIYQQLINGLMLGASYALIAIGYTLIFGVLRLLYFAHGEVFMVGAFAGLYLVILGGANIYVALLGALIACAMLGIIAVYVSVRPVSKAAAGRMAGAVAVLAVDASAAAEAVDRAGRPGRAADAARARVLGSNNSPRSRRIRTRTTTTQRSWLPVLSVAPAAD